MKYSHIHQQKTRLSVVLLSLESTGAHIIQDHTHKDKDIALKFKKNGLSLKLE